MDKRYNSLSITEQLQLRKQAVDDVLAHPEWSLPEAVRHLKKTMRLTTAEMARLSGVGYRTMQDIEQERSEGTVQVPDVRGKHQAGAVGLLRVESGDLEKVQMQVFALQRHVRVGLGHGFFLGVAG